MSLLNDIQAVLLPLGIEVGLFARHLERGAEVAINPDLLFPTASVFKVPVMVELFRQAEAGKYSLDDRMPTGERLRTMGSGVLQKLAAGVAPTRRDLAMLMIIISDNTATEMLLDLVGPANVTAAMRMLGIDDIHVVLNLGQLFAHAYGLPTDPPPGYEAMLAASRTRKMDYGSLAFAPTGENTTSSAAAMARLLAMIAQGTAAGAASCAEMVTILKAQQLRDRAPRYLPTGAVGNKTGTFRGIRNDAGLIWRGPEDTIAFGLFTFDRTELPVGNSRLLAERNMRVNGAMAEIGQILWEGLATA
jgi:beta-lactamase class A